MLWTIDEKYTQKAIGGKINDTKIIKQKRNKRSVDNTVSTKWKKLESLSIVIWNINGFTSHTKWHRLTEWLKSTVIFFCLQETHLIIKIKHNLSMKGWKKKVQVNGIKKQVAFTLLISDRLGFKTNIVRRD